MLSDSGDTSSSSEEGGGRDYEIPLIVPPPSPAIAKKLFKPKLLPVKPKQQTKSPVMQRKPLPVKFNALNWKHTQKHIQKHYLQLTLILEDPKKDHTGTID